MMHRSGAALTLFLISSLGSITLLSAQDRAPAPPAESAGGASSAPFEAYTQVIDGTTVQFRMVPVQGGEFLMGSPETESGRAADEGPQRKVKVDPFWMGACEVTWDEYELWQFSLEVQRRAADKVLNEADRTADAVTRPTKPYTDMTFGMGKEGYPAICMTRLAAVTYCEWLSARTGQWYRLPTEAEWEFAARGGTQTPWNSGAQDAELQKCAWFEPNSEGKTHPVGKLTPNAFGLHDMHGNVMELCLDQYAPYGVATADVLMNPLVAAQKIYPTVARGGAWNSSATQLRCAARVGSSRAWKQKDPQIPQSKWYFTDALFVGFRIVRPLTVPSAEERARFR